jgi:hypothetical protein
LSGLDRDKQQADVRPRFDRLDLGFPVNKLVKYLSPKGVHHCNLKLLVVSQTAVAKLPRKLVAMHNGFRIGLKFHTDTISHWHAILHVEEKRLHEDGPLV